MVYLNVQRPTKTMIHLPHGISSLMSLKGEGDADGLIDSSSLWMELSISSASETSVSLAVEMEGASRVY
jgi:hypothetical protein